MVSVKNLRYVIQIACLFPIFLSPILMQLSGCSSATPPLQIRKLPSGRAVKIQGVVQMNFTQGPPALMLKYQTDLKITEKSALRTEVDDIWSAFRYDVDRSSFKIAIISANEASHGFIITTSNSYNFVYRKQADGSWRCENDASPN